MVVYVYMVIMLLLVVFIFLYNIFSYPIALTTQQITPLINATNSSVTADALNTIDIIGNVWKYWPILLILGLVIWGLIASQRQEPLYGYAGG